MKKVCSGCGAIDGQDHNADCPTRSVNPFKGTKWQPKPTDTPPEAIDAVATKAAERRAALATRRGTILDRDALTDALVALSEPLDKEAVVRRLASYFSVLDLKAIVDELSASK